MNLTGHALECIINKKIKMSTLGTYANTYDFSTTMHIREQTLHQSSDSLVWRFYGSNFSRFINRLMFQAFKHLA